MHPRPTVRLGVRCVLKRDTLPCRVPQPVLGKDYNATKEYNAKAKRKRNKWERVR